MKRITGFPTRPNMVQQLLDVGFDYYNLLPLTARIIGLIMWLMNLP